MLAFLNSTQILKLEGQPSSRKGVIEKAVREGWKKRPHDGRGGGFDYEVECNNIITKNKYKYINKIKFPQGYVKDVENEERYLAHLEIIRAFDRYKRSFDYESCKILQVEVQFSFCHLYNKHQIDFPNYSPYELIPQISRSKLCRDLKKLNEAPETLGNNWGGKRTGGTAIANNPETEKAIVSCLKLGKTKWTIPQILKALESQFNLDFIPSQSQIRRFVNKFKKNNYLQWLHFKNKDEARSKMAVAFGNASEDLSEPNQRWELDGTKTDVMLQTDKGMKRYQIIGLIDVFTRRVKLHIAPSESSQNTLHALRNTISAWGLPQEIKTDNGSGFTAKRTQAFLARLGIKLSLCPPGQPQKKPHIERFFRTFNHDLLPLIPGYIGHNVSDRKDLRSHGEVVEIAMTPERFQEWCDQWCSDYECREHRGIHTTPLEKYTNAIADGFVRKQVEDIRLLDYLLMEGTPRKISKQGIQVNNKVYIASELGGLISNSVYVCYDSKKPDEIIVYSDEMLEDFICIAQWRDSYLVDKVAISQQAKEKQKQLINEIKTNNKATKKVIKKLEDDPFSLLNNSSITPLQQIEKIKNDSISTVKEMVSSTKSPEIVELSQEELKQRQDNINTYREIRSRKNQVVDVVTQQQRFKQFYLLHLEGGDLSQEQTEFIDRFSATPGGEAIRKRLDSIYERRIS